MFGNLQVRFLGGSGAARLPSYPVPERMTMNLITKIVLIAPLFFSVQVHGETYQWTDAEGVIHFSDNASSIPQKSKNNYRKIEDVSSKAQSQSKHENINSENRSTSKTDDKVAEPKSEQIKLKEIESQLLNIWQSFKSAVIRKDFKTAYNLLSGNEESYEHIFKNPSVDVVARFKEIERIEIFDITERTAEAGAIRKENNKEYAYPLSFIKDIYGEWKIYKF